MKLTKGRMTILDMLEKGESVTVDNATCKPNGKFTLDAICSLLQAGLIEIVDSYLVTEYGLTENGRLVLESRPRPETIHETFQEETDAKV